MRYDGNAMTTRYVTRTLEATLSADMRCFGMNCREYEEDMYCVVGDKKVEGGGNRKYWVQPCCNKSGELDCIVVARELGQYSERFRLFCTGRYRKVLNCVLSRITRTFPVIQRGISPTSVRSLGSNRHSCLREVLKL